MVVPLRPAKFYGSSLPRPQFYTDVKFSATRVDPPASPLDPLLDWAREAHWSMGGLSFKRILHQGKIEGNIKKLRAEDEKREKNSARVEKVRARDEKRAKKNDSMQKLRILEEQEEERAIENENQVKIKSKKSSKRVRSEKETEKKVSKTGKKEAHPIAVETRRKLKKRSGKKEAPPAAVAAPADEGLRRSKRRKLVLRDEEDGEMEF